VSRLLLAAATAAAFHAAAAEGALSHYDLRAAPADRWTLPKELNEISGLAVDRRGRVFAHGDERAIVYQLDPATHRVLKRFSFGHPAVRGDFEGIAVTGEQLTLTTSDGVLYTGREGQDGEAVPYTIRDSGVGRRCEVEGLAYESSDRSLLLACKTPRIESLRGKVAVFGWSLDRGAPAASLRVVVPQSQVVGRVGGSTFHPSELTRDPVTGNYLVLAAREHLIAELTPAGAVADVRRLRPSLHRQPEGLAFVADGALLVADEANGKRATLTVYRRSP
jgi:hypothetical protein